MRILLAHNLWFITGGAEVFFRETERILREAGHETLMIATGERRGDEPDNLILLEAPDYQAVSPLRRAMAFPSAVYDPGKKRAFAEAIEAFRPDIVHIFSIYVHLSLSPIDAVSEAKIPLVASFNDYKHICPNHKLFTDGDPCFACKGRRFRNAVVKKCCKDSLTLSIASMIEADVHQALGLYEKIDHFTFSSDFMAETTQAFWPERPLSFSKLRNPFDSPRHATDFESEPFALYFGRLVDQKGVDRIIDAAGSVDGFPIKIVGSGPEEEHLRARVARKGLSNVEFLGELWGPELDALLARARCVLVPSLWHENYPYVINQAFALGRPVIGSRRGGIVELVEDGERGFLVEPDEADGLASAIRELARNPALAGSMGRRAKEWSDEMFNDRRFLSDLIAAYEATRSAHSRRGV